MAKPETITSAANPLLKDVRRAISRGSLTENGLCVAETFHLLDEALRSHCDVPTVLAADSAAARVQAAGVTPVVLPDALFRSISSTETSQGVVALVKPPEWKAEDLVRGCPLVVILDGLQDPGNAGAIVRAAEAFGASGIFFLKGAVSPFNPKTLRAAAGSLFRVPFLHGVDAELARQILAQHGVKLFAGVPAHSNGAALPEFAARCGLIVGSEAHGVSAALRAAAVHVAIPTLGVESLNAAMAAGILLYEARRQRMVQEMVRA